MLTQQIPFDGSIMKVLKKIADTAPDPPSSHNPELAGSAIERMCLKMMEKSQSDRFACMSDVAEVAEDIVAERSSGEGTRGKRRFAFWPFS